ncbi:NUDIX domain-containing protein [Streptomyces sp. NPDC048277]|uniref:NUDIX domain-containing protein n=1 Tax=Streptomyces sp. NPDC048277 TaxID=3155027 RepID=UPI0033EF0C4C
MTSACPRASDRDPKQKDATVPPALSEINNLVHTYLARYPDERLQLQNLLALLQGTAGDPTSRATLPGHITCSAVVIDQNLRVLHSDHKATGLVLAPGGRVESDDRTLLATALRQVREGAGIAPGALCLTRQFLESAADINVHDIAADPAEGEPAHQRYDVRFVFYLAGNETPAITPRSDEVSEATWCPLADVTSPTLRAKLQNAQLDGRPEPVNASVVIHDGAGRYLLHLRDQRDGIWEPGAFALLGGGWEPQDPSLESTLLRELTEEVPGLRLCDLMPFSVEYATSIDGLCVPAQVFTGRWNGNPDEVILNEGVLLRWFAPEMLHRLRLLPSTADIIHHHAAQLPAFPRMTVNATVRNVIGVHLYLEDDHGRVLLGQCHPSSPYAGGMWHFLAGHCERESAIQCLIREAFEEAGLVIDQRDVTHAHTMHLRDAPDAEPRMQIVFRVRTWQGTPQVLEPDKCQQWQWWQPQTLPEPVVPYTRHAIEKILNGQPYSEMGW